MNAKNTKNQKSKNNTPNNYYSVGLMQSGNTFKVVNSFVLKKVNQHKHKWKRTSSQMVARQLNKGKLVIK